MLGIVIDLLKQNGISLAVIGIIIISFSAVYKLLMVIKDLLVKISTNHLRHLQDSINEILDRVKNLENKDIEMDKRVLVLETKIEDK